MPRFLQRYTTPLRNAPVTHVTAFLVLHELTAIVPLFGLVAVFHYTDWMPPFISEGKWVADGVQKFGNYFKRKGWLGEEDKSVVRWWDRGEGSVKIVVECVHDGTAKCTIPGLTHCRFATAYAVTKALLPLRLLLSVWGTPWFARITVVPVLSIVKRLFRRAPKAGVTTVSGAAGTGATAAGVGPTSTTMQTKK